MNFIKKAFSAIGVLCLTIGVCSIVNATRNSMLIDCSQSIKKDHKKVNYFDIVTMGKSDSGKMEIFEKLYNKDRYSHIYYSNFGESHMEEEDNNSIYDLKLTDVPHDQRYDKMCSHCLKKADMGLLVYKEGTLDNYFEYIKEWIRIYKDYANNNRIILISYKKDDIGYVRKNSIFRGAKKLGLENYIDVYENGMNIGNLKDLIIDMCKEVIAERSLLEAVKLTYDRENSRSNCF